MNIEDLSARKGHMLKLDFSENGEASEIGYLYDVKDDYIRLCHFNPRREAPNLLEKAETNLRNFKYSNVEYSSLRRNDEIEGVTADLLEDKVGKPVELEFGQGNLKSELGPALVMGYVWKIEDNRVYLSGSEPSGDKPRFGASFETDLFSYASSFKSCHLLE